MTRRRLQVLRPGLLTTVQDAGRPGHAHIGVPPSGALDRPAYELANRLVGNRAGAAGLETTMEGPTLVLHSTRVHHIALTGAPAPLWVDGRPVALYAPVSVLPGQQIEIGRASAGLRSYLGVSGGLHGEQVLGSLSTDVLSGLGPPVLAAGSSIELGWPGAVAPVDVVPVRQPADRAVLAIMTGPRLDWFTGDALAVLTSGLGGQLGQQPGRRPA
jgi:allophanate hydrolase subunit 2